MRRKNQSGAGTIVARPAGPAAGSQSLDASPEQSTAPALKLDFFSDEFNKIDELDDNIGNYRSFQSLAGIVTSDMRHQENRKKTEASAGSIAEIPEERQEESPDEPPVGSQGSLSLTIVSRGRLLLIDTNLERAINCAESLSNKAMTCTLCVPGRGAGGISISRIGSLVLVEVDAILISGGFGGFTAGVPRPDGGRTELSTLTGQLSNGTGHGAGYFDLVLDLQAVPSFTGRQLPVGYYAPGEDKVRLEAVLLELPEMRGRFQKPRLAVLLENRCLHGRSPSGDCRRCLDICPVAAIKAENRKIDIDHYLCQGCGACALVCPADAIRRLHPPPEELPAELGRLVAESIAIHAVPPDLILYDRKREDHSLYGTGGMTFDGTLFFEVEDIGHVGLEVLLGALAWGAGSVTLVCEQSRPEEIRAALERQVRLGAVILQDLHLPADSLRFVVQPSSGEVSGSAPADPGGCSLPGRQVPPAKSARPVILPAAFSLDHDKRTLIRLAAEHLAKHHVAAPPVVPLPAGAPFGAIAIGQACSLCMACVGACPSGALVAGGDVLRLSLVESRCHQCGFCLAVCPEQAIRLQPRLLWNSAAADMPAVLREVEPFRCVECGEPFAAPAMISRMEEKLNGHWMFGGKRQRRRLRMCRTCRTRDALTAGEYHP